MAWLVVAAVIVLPFLVHVKRHGELADLYSGEAFAAFYCAGEAIDANRDGVILFSSRKAERIGSMVRLLDQLEDH